MIAAAIGVLANRKEHRVDRRRAIVRTGKRQCDVVMRERNGGTLPFVIRSESASCARLSRTVGEGSIIYADEASAWDGLEARYLTKRINHSEAYSTTEACTNLAESFVSRLRRAEIGTHHHIAGPYLNAYAGEMSWREDNRRISNRQEFLAAVGATLNRGISR